VPAHKGVSLTWKVKGFCRSPLDHYFSDLTSEIWWKYKETVIRLEWVSAPYAGFTAKYFVQIS